MAVLHVTCRFDLTNFPVYNILLPKTKVSGHSNVLCLGSTSNVHAKLDDNNYKLDQPIVLHVKNITYRMSP